MTGARVVDRYTLDREVGRGACGAVWAAEDEVLQRPVAIKRVGPPPGADHSEAVRAEREARLAAQVNHPNVISVFDLVHHEAHYWLVMEYVDGAPLSTLIRERGPLAAEEVADLIAPVADALAAAHDLGIVHRDVKPSNILVGRQGEVKLSDFGIARAVQDATITMTDSITGSPAYLAPELATGGPATPASDVWALGATLFHALAGAPPYHSDTGDNTVLAVLFRVVNEAPPRLPDAGWLGPLLERTMARDPGSRMTMAEVRDFLLARGETAGAATQLIPTRSTAAPAPPPPPPPPPPADLQPHRRRPVPARSRTGLLAAAAVVVLVGLGISLLLLGGGAGETEQPAAAAVSNSGSVGPVGAGDESTPPDPEALEPTAQELVEFAELYVRTADRDPAAGFAMLTPDYQRRSPDYQEFWGSMSNPRILDVEANPEALTVTYTYEYDLPDAGGRTETVTLLLVEEDGTFLIAGAA